VLCITHLPQIAARGEVQLLIDKAVRGGRTHTSVTRLDGEARVAEVARMIAGAGVTPAVLASAGEMLATRKAGEQTPKGESESRRPAKAKASRGA
jgi:DNA repair protein RecN (Recombination protein N)